ncbi:MAG: hypothetical protein SFW66_09015 [Gammaproteobacteria bacterium]|nr:hypothetical protein [Gammaproteobacteria bacterium]
MKYRCKVTSPWGVSGKVVEKVGGFVQAIAGGMGVSPDHYPDLFEMIEEENPMDKILKPMLNKCVEYYKPVETKTVWLVSTTLQRDMFGNFCNPIAVPLDDVDSLKKAYESEKRWADTFKKQREVCDAEIASLRAKLKVAEELMERELPLDLYQNYKKIFREA